MLNCIVTGGSRGIGRGVVQRLLEEGHRVVMCDIDPISAEKLQNWVDRHQYHDNYMFVVTDVSKEDSIRHLFTTITSEFMPSIDVIVNNAAIASQHYRQTSNEDRFDAEYLSSLNPHAQETIKTLDLPLLNLNFTEWDRYLQINLTSIYLMSKYGVPFMVRSSLPVEKQPIGSTIINISSTRALMSEPNTEAYSTTKGGVVSLTHSLAMSLGKHGIRVNCILPGWIDTLGHFSDDEEDSTQNQTPNAANGPTPVQSSPVKAAEERTQYTYHDQITADDHAFHPVQRIGVPYDISECVLFLADGTKSGFITGQQFVIDGGVTKKMIYDAENINAK